MLPFSARKCKRSLLHFSLYVDNNNFVLSAGIEPTLRAPQARVLSVELREEEYKQTIKNRVSRQSIVIMILDALLRANNQTKIDE